MRISDWSSDVCSSDLWCRPAKYSSTPQTSAPASANPQPRSAARHDDSARRLIHTSGTTQNTVASAEPHSSETACAARVAWPDPDRQRVGLGKRVSVRVAFGVGRIIQHKQNKTKYNNS